jgi:thiamine-phosphate pyrophosphorylase
VIDFKLVLITDWSLPDCLERIADALQAGAGMAVQHRHPGVDEHQLLLEGRRLRGVVGSTPLFVNGSLAVADALHAGLHRNSSLRAAPLVSRAHRVSSSWHPPELPPAGVDLLLVSPIFAPTSKPADRPPLGVAGYRRACQQTQVPVFALGGITPARVRELWPCAGVGVIGSVLHHPSPRTAARALLDALVGLG